MFVDGGAAQAAAMNNIYTPKSGWRYGWSIAKVTLDRYMTHRRQQRLARHRRRSRPTRAPTHYDTHQVIGQPTVVPASDYYLPRYRARPHET